MTMPTDTEMTFAQQLVIDFLNTPQGKQEAEKCITDVLKKAIDSATGYNSEFRKQVNDAMIKALQLSDGIEIESYNHAILKIIERQVQHATADTIERQVAERMKSLLTPAPTEIKLSQLAEQYREFLKEKSDSGCVCHGEQVMTFIHENSDGIWDYFGFDEESGKALRKCDIQLGIYKEKLFSLNFESSDVEKRMFVGPLYGFHRSLFQMKAAQTKVVIDCTPDDVELDYSNHDS